MGTKSKMKVIIFIAYHLHDVSHRFLLHRKPIPKPRQKRRHVSCPAHALMNGSMEWEKLTKSSIPRRGSETGILT